MPRNRLRRPTSNHKHGITDVRASIFPGSARDRSGLSRRSAPLRSMPAASRWRCRLQPDGQRPTTSARRRSKSASTCCRRVSIRTICRSDPDTGRRRCISGRVEQKAVVEQSELAEGGADRDRRSRPGRHAKRHEKAARTGSEGHRRSGRSFDRIGGDRGDGDADRRDRAGIAALGRALAGNRRQRQARARDLAKGTGRPFQQVQALSVGSGHAGRGGRRQLRPRPDRTRGVDATS